MRRLPRARARGIATGFIHEDEKGKRLFSSRDRLVPALWEIASASGKRVGVVNWLQTYPAEHVNGFVISERYRPLSAEIWLGRRRWRWSATSGVWSIRPSYSYD